MEQKVDEACEVVPAYVNPRKIRLASSHIGWRLYLYGSSLKRAGSGFFVHIRSEQDMDIFLRETAEKSDTTILRIKRFLREKARLLAVLDDAGMRLRFATTLYLFGLAALGTLAVGGREMALCALAACLMLLSAAMEAGFDLKALPVVILGGGAGVAARNLRESDRLCRVISLTDSRINAAGFERLAQQMAALGITQ